jgi:hypothetical protein
LTFFEKNYNIEKWGRKKVPVLGLLGSNVLFLFQKNKKLNFNKFIIFLRFLAFVWCKKIEKRFIFGISKCRADLVLFPMCAGVM